MRTLKLGVLQKESVLRQIRKTAENAAAQNPEERVN